MSTSSNDNQSGAIDATDGFEDFLSFLDNTDPPKQGPPAGTQVVLSLGDFNEMRDQQRNMQEQQRMMQGQIDSLKRQQEDKSKDEGKVRFLEEENKGDASGDDDADSLEGAERHTILTESILDRRDDKYELPESVYTLLMTEKVVSIPFAAGIISGGFSLACLILALINEFDDGTIAWREGSLGLNPLGVPAGVQHGVRAAQYLGIMIGVLMEDEIPQALEIIGKGYEQGRSSASIRRLSARIQFSKARIVLPALLRLAVGYTFLCCLFLTVVQQTNVLGIFFDILALEFVENIDDFVCALSKRGFFGAVLLVATNNEHYIATSGTSSDHKVRKRTKRLIRFIYAFNAVAMMALLTYVASQQQKGKYRCNSVTLSFGDAHWEDAYVTIGDAEPQKRLLIYSHFNGVYEEAGSHDGRPKYTERNKEDGAPFKVTTPAEIIYCQDIEAWVLRHEHIKTSNDKNERNNENGRREENECSWLMRSPKTESYDIVELAEETEWFVYTGRIETDYRVSIECDECEDNADCNYNGNCETQKCDCNGNYFGTHCQFEYPCKEIRSEKNSATTLQLVADPLDENVDFLEVYQRPVYVIHNMTGKPYDFLRLGYPDDDDKYFNVTYHGPGTDSFEELVSHKHYQPDFFEDDDFFEQNTKDPGFKELLNNYSFVLVYTGRRWYGRLVQPGRMGENFDEQEHHAFWKNTFSGLGEQDNSTLIISAPTSDGSPVGVDFYEMRRRNIAFETGTFDYDYDPYGVLVPLVEYEGSGFFHCNKDDPKLF